MKKHLALLLALCLFAAMLAGCSPASDGGGAQDDAQTPDTGEPQDGGTENTSAKDSLVIAAGADHLFHGPAAQKGYPVGPHQDPGV